MAASCSGETPSVGFQQLDDVADFHAARNDQDSILPALHAAVHLRSEERLEDEQETLQVVLFIGFRLFP